MKGLTVLGCGLDTVEVSYSGDINSHVATKLDNLKGVTQATGVPQPVTLGALEFMVQDKAFGFWRWRAVHPLLSIVACPESGVSGIVAQVRLSSFGLVNEDSETLLSYVHEALTALGDLTEVAVSRADARADVQGLNPTREMMSNVVCKAHKRGQIGTETAVETYSYGTGNRLRVYNKTVEAIEKKKPWCFDVWGRQPEYDPNGDVWRVEFQARRERLKELGITSLAILFADPGALLDAGMRWAQLRIPNGENKTRWEEDERWTEIRTAAFGGEPLRRAVKPHNLMSLDRARAQYLGAIATAGAYFGTTDYMAANIKLSYAVEAHMIAEDVDFPAFVESKRRRILSNDF